MTDTAEPTVDEGGTVARQLIGDSPEGNDLWERVPHSPELYGEVSDWATDIDHADPNYNPNAPEIWKDLRESGCPVAHSERYGGMWAPITHETVHEVAYDTENFTSRSVVVSHLRPGDLALPAPIGTAPPITSDPPFHNMARRILLPPFAPKQIEPWEEDVQALCNRLLDAMGDIEPGETVVDAAVQYAQHIPVNVIGRMLGFPEEHEELFRTFVHNTLETINEAPEVRRAGFIQLDEYIDAQIQDHIDNPRDDLTSYLLGCELDGNPLEPMHVRGSIILLLIAGIDTTWSAIGASLWHLAGNEGDRTRLRACLEMVAANPVAEQLRAARDVRSEVPFATTIGGYYAITAAMRVGEIGAVTPFRYSRLVFGLVLGMAIFAERPDALAYAGAALILAAGLYSAWRERLHSKS